MITTTTHRLRFLAGPLLAGLVAPGLLGCADESPFRLAGGADAAPAPDGLDPLPDGALVDGPPPPPDAIAAPDAPPSTACGFPTTFSSTDEGAFTGPLGVWWFSNIGPGDQWRIELKNGVPPFQAGVTTGTFTLAHDPQSDCGVCVSLATDLFEPTNRNYVAVSGTLNVTSVEGTFAATATNVLFREVAWDEVNDRPGALIPGGCSGTLSSRTISEPFQ